MRRGCLLRAAAMSVVAATMAACETAASRTSPTVAAHEVVLPALSGALPTVRSQIEARHADLTRLIAARPPAAELSDAYGAFGQLLLAAGFAGAAEPALLDARDLAPSDARWWYYLGGIYRDRGDNGHAQQAYERVLQLTPDNVAAHVYLGRVLLDAGQTDRAEPEFARAAALVPNFAAEFGLGRVALEKKNYPAAVQHLERALALEPKASLAHYQLALAYRAAGQTALADQHFARRGMNDVAPPDPLMDRLRSLLDNPQTDYKAAQESLRRGAIDEAIELYRRGLALNPEDWRLREVIRNSLGRALLRKGDTAGAVEQFQAGIRAVPDRPEHYVDLGITYLSMGRREEGVAQLKAALQRDPHYGPALDAMRRVQEARPR